MIQEMRVVFDCNTLIQALASPSAASGQCVQLAFDRQLTMFLSKTVLEEFNNVASRPKVVRKLRLTPDRVNAFV